MISPRFRMPQLAALTMVTLLLAGCALESVAVSSQPGYPSEYEIENPFSGEPVAFWHPDRSQFDVVVIASSTCDLIPTKLELAGEHTAALTFVRPRGDCATNLSSTTYTFETPDSLEGDVEVEVSVDDDVTTIPIRDAVDGAGDDAAGDTEVD